MAKWYDEYLTDQEKKHLQVGQKGIRARQRKQIHEQNVKTAQANTLERERQSGAAYAKKMQSDSDRSREEIRKAFVNQRVEQKYDRNRAEQKYVRNASDSATRRQVSISTPTLKSAAYQNIRNQKATMIPLRVKQSANRISRGDSDTLRAVKMSTPTLKEAYKKNRVR